MDPQTTVCMVADLRMRNSGSSDLHRGWGRGRVPYIGSDLWRAGGRTIVTRQSLR